MRRRRRGQYFFRRGQRVMLVTKSSVEDLPGRFPYTYSLKSLGSSSWGTAAFIKAPAALRNRSFSFGFSEGGQFSTAALTSAAAIEILRARRSSTCSEAAWLGPFSLAKRARRSSMWRMTAGTPNAASHSKLGHGPVKNGIYPLQ